MSYHNNGYDRPRGGGGRRRYRDDYEDQRRGIVESPQEQVKNAILRLGEVDPVQELTRVEDQIRALQPPSVQALSEAFRYGITEQPYKTPFYVALLRLLHEKKAEDDEEKAPLGRQILEDFWKGFQAYMDKLAWRDIKHCIQFFAHATVAHLVSAESLLSLIQSFVAVLDEFGVSHGRAKLSAACIADALMIAGSILPSTAVADIITALRTYSESVANTKYLAQPMSRLDTVPPTLENAHEILENMCTVLQKQHESNFVEETDSYVRPYAAYSPYPTAFELPSVLVPPEVIELDAFANDLGEEPKKEEWSEYSLRLFDNDVTPNPDTAAGYAVRAALLSIIDIFEINRKECARLLLEYPKWTQPGTFKPKPGAPVDVEPIPDRDWQLESTLLELILGCDLLLPESRHKSVYYASLITELCKLSPSTVGPAVGKSIRRLYGNLADGLDVEVSRRFAEWFALHMSNFGFQWVWKEWIPDLQLTLEHPRRIFMRRAVEFEIRLAYYERIAKSLPQEMQDREANTLPEEAPGPWFEYEEPTHVHHDAAESVLNLFRGRAKADDVVAHLDSLKSTLESSEEGNFQNVESIIRILTVQSLLHIGSRSFSHLLNALERYLPLLRSIASSGAGKADILTAVATFWKLNQQMIGIVFDKLMQYQIVDPVDVVDWVFNLTKDSSLGGSEWDLLRAALDKANGRVLIARRRVIAVRKEDEETRAREKAGGTDMEVDSDIKTEEAPTEESPALSTARKAFDSLTKEQQGALSRALEGFTRSLGPPTLSAAVLTEDGWFNRANWTRDEWVAWETWGWYKQFCRSYAPYLRTHVDSLQSTSFARLQSSAEPSAVLLLKIWNLATGQES